MTTPKCILLVEDNADNRLIYSMLLRHSGFEVLEAETGEAGLALARSRMPDLILLDISLPGMSGIHVREELRHDPATAAIPVFAVTAHSFAQELEQIMAAGFDRVLTKPVEPRVLLQEVTTWFEELPPAG